MAALTLSPGGKGAHMSDTQHTLSRLTDRDIWCNITNLVYEIGKIASFIPYNADSEISCDVLLDMTRIPGDLKEAVRHEGWDVEEHPAGFFYIVPPDGPTPFGPHPDYVVFQTGSVWEWRHVDSDTIFSGFCTEAKALENLWRFELAIDEFDDEEDAWEQIARDERIEVDDIDVLEHHVVSRFFAEKLEEVGERVVRVCNLNVWCRTCSGQSVILDSCIEEIARRMEILPGQAYEWGE